MEGDPSTPSFRRRPEPSPIARLCYVIEVSEQKHAVVLRTERLVLRPFRLEDVDDFFEYARDPDWARYLALPQPYTRSDAEEFVARQVLKTREGHGEFAIELKERAVGSVDLAIDVPRQTAFLRYSLAKRLWGRGLALEAAREVVRWGFETHGLAKVWACADERNRRSLRVQEKLGLRREGLLMKHDVIRGERVDVAYYGLLREEWEKDRLITGHQRTS